MSRIIAVDAYLAASAAPASADWRAVADSLFSALPKARGTTADAGQPAWWIDYKLGKVFRFASMDVLFHDGESVRVTVSSMPGKLPRIPAAARGAIGFYRSRHGQDVAVPAFASLTICDTGQTYDAATVSRLTAEARAIPGTVQRKAMTVERVEWMAREVERRRAGMVRAQAEESARLAARAQRVKLGLGVAEVNAEVEAERLARFTSQPSSGWAEALAAGEAELAMMREALARERGAVDDVAPVVVPDVAPEAVAPVMAHPAPVAAPMDADEAQAMWCDAVAEAYGQPEAWEVTGTDGEAEAGESVPLATTPEANSVNVLAGDSDTLATTPAEAIASGTPAEAIEAWEPTAETHPVIALALSDKARAALFDAVLDGTFPAETGNARAGAWRVTLADALALQGLSSIRWVGMPRKAYTRRPVTPAEAIQARTPGEAIHILPHAAYIPGAGRAPSPVTLHAAP